MVNLDHLHPDYQVVAMQDTSDRLLYLSKERWIGYTRAQHILTRLEKLFVEEPQKIRPQNLLIVGPSNNGKTMIAQKFCRQHQQHNSADSNHEIIPVLMVQMPAEATIGRLYNAILMALGTPVGFYGRHDVREARIIQLMQDVRVQMLMIDEIHNLLGASAKRQREVLNLLRYLGNQLRIPIVCLGIRDAYLAIRTDDQLENRFHPVVLPVWEIGEEFARLLVSFEAILPLREQSYLAEPTLMKLILQRSEGTIGEISRLLTQAAVLTLQKGSERIDKNVIEQADYQSPSVRRHLIERSLR